MIERLAIAAAIGAQCIMLFAGVGLAVHACAADADAIRANITAAAIPPPVAIAAAEAAPGL